MIDFHTHILPNVDDGSSDLHESVEMLKMLNEQNAEAVVLTPHYYRAEETVAEFLKRREYSLSNLRNSLGGRRIPRLFFGVEVAFFTEMSKDEAIQKLCIDGTNTLLLEMPFTVWRAPVLNEVHQLLTCSGIKPVIAHIERYIGEPQNINALEQLIGFGAVIQANAEFFLERRTRRKAFSMLRNGLIHVFGSDCHNIEDRKPNMGELESLLRKKIPTEKFAELQNHSRSLLPAHPRHCEER
ncbi:MAG: capsular polysaccharide biosynthesis protein [Oscillospiraceae bacterium]|jgi:protein-tyrosine phosphatase|nr:capsular polysaccharide biosynthesis protein [Oscillospiraceae bacterium]